MREDTGPGLVQPTLPTNANLKLKGHILAQLKELPFYGKDYEDAYKHLEEVNDIADYFNVPNVARKTVFASYVTRYIQGGRERLAKITSSQIHYYSDKMKEEFIDQFCPPSKIAKLKKAIANFEQQSGESLYEAWERYKSLLRNCPHHDLNSQQEVSIFHDGVNVTTRQLLDSQGPLTKKAPPMIKQLIEEFSKHSREYHNPRNELAKGSVNAASEDMAAVLAMLDNMDRRMTKMDQTIHVIRVGCENCNGPHLTRDCDLDENGNRMVQAFYSSSDRFDDNWRKPKKNWIPYEEYEKAKEERYEQKKEEPQAEKKSDLENMITRFIAASEKRHEGDEAAIKEQQVFMREQQETMRNTQALVRNQQASILTIEKQLGQLASQLNERSPGALPGNTKQKPERSSHSSHHH
ncbi:uncharacterized protein LOC111895073 [Lactuca sativa]|uniref:uncharacterized protein LOC111895073 n=1 Tax=Lactuca sativa TaxID=4236 RepID=UPI000CD8D656|nr:uncharacterized protein LOC111895073 [Lactuca sativa]